MDKRSNTSADDRSKKLQRQAQNLLVKADHQMVVSAMKTHGSAAASCCKRALVSMGFIDPTTNTVVPSGFVSQPPSIAKPIAIEDDPSAPRSAPKLGSTWISTETKIMRNLLTDIEPVTLSFQNLRSLAKKQAKDVPKDKILEVLEFVLGLDPGGAPPANKSYEHIKQFMMRRNDAMGRRSANLTLPADWSKVGVYVVEFKDDCWKLKNQYRDQEVTLDTLDDPEGKLQLTINHNFSEKRAVVHDAGHDVVHEVCFTFFNFCSSEGACDETPTPKRRKVSSQLALCAGAPGTPGSTISSAASGKSSRASTLGLPAFKYNEAGEFLAVPTEALGQGGIQALGDDSKAAQALAEDSQALADGIQAVADDSQALGEELGQEQEQEREQAEQDLLLQEQSTEHEEAAAAASGAATAEAAFAP
jgi:hypothetical protein